MGWRGKLMSSRRRRAPLRIFQSPEGMRWSVEVTVPSSSNAMVYYRHPDGASARKDRYAWYISHGPEARNVTARMNPSRVLESLTDQDLARLYRRSMPVSAEWSLKNVAAAGGSPAPAKGRRAVGESV